MLNDGEAREAFVGLDRLLREKGLDWVCDQVQDEIRLGKLERKEVETVKELRSTDETKQPSLRKPMGKGRKVTLMTVGEFSPQERLRILIDAMQRAVVDTGDLEQDVAAFFNSPPRQVEANTDVARTNAEMDAAREIRFVRLDQRRSDTVTTPERPLERGDAIRRLRGLIDELRGEI
jgi:hypothetical protein